MAAASASFVVSIEGECGPIGFYWRQLNMKATALQRLLTMTQTCLWITQSVHENYHSLLNDSEKEHLEKFATSVAGSTVNNLEDLIIILQSLDTPLANMANEIEKEMIAVLLATELHELGEKGSLITDGSNQILPPTSQDTSAKNILPFKTTGTATRRSRGCPYDRGSA